MKARSLISQIMALTLAVTAPSSLHAQHRLFKIRDHALSAGGPVHGANVCAKFAEGPHQRRGECSVVLLNSLSVHDQRVFHLQVFSSDQRTSQLVFGAHEPLARVVSRDVNRDGAFDLVVEQSLTRRPLQVWLNDGHENFTPASAARFRLKGREPPHHLVASQSGRAFPRLRSLLKRGSKLILDRVLASSNHGFSSPQHSFLFMSADEQEPRGPNPCRAPPAPFFI